MSLMPPSCFGIVEAGVYRSNAPAECNLSFLARLQLKTVLYLSPDVLLKAVVNFFQIQNVKLHNLGLQAWRPGVSWTPVSQELIKDALEIVLDESNHPILVCCTSGIHQTGVVVGCLRTLQRWALSSILDEYRCFAGSKARNMHEQFIELFDPDLVNLPQRLPEWIKAHIMISKLEEQEWMEINKLLSTNEENGKDEKQEEIVDEETGKTMMTQKQRLMVLKLHHSRDPSLLVSSPGQYTNVSLIDDDDDD